MSDRINNTFALEMNCMATVAMQGKQRWIIWSDAEREIAMFQLQMPVAKNLARSPIDFILFL